MEYATPHTSTVAVQDFFQASVNTYAKYCLASEEVPSPRKSRRKGKRPVPKPDFVWLKKRKKILQQVKRKK